MKSTMARRAMPVEPASAMLVKARRWLDVTRPRALRWWAAQTVATKLAFVVASLFVVVAVINLTTAGLGRLTAQSQPTAAVAPALTLEAAPNDAAKVWTVAKIWQGSGSRETESFTVTGHWRVDWLFNATQPGGSLQVFIYSADGKLLLNRAANAQAAGADTTFWAGPGTYFLKINSSGGDWKVDVQDLR